MQLELAGGKRLLLLLLGFCSSEQAAAGQQHLAWVAWPEPEQQKQQQNQQQMRGQMLLLGKYCSASGSNDWIAGTQDVHCCQLARQCSLG
jgi:hypothetical protein